MPIPSEAMYDKLSEAFNRKNASIDKKLEKAKAITYEQSVDEKGQSIPQNSDSQKLPRA